MSSKKSIEGISGCTTSRTWSNECSINKNLNWSSSSYIHTPVYRVMSPHKLPSLEKEVKGLLEAGLIEPSTSPWASPIILVPKPGGAVRFCVDCRKLNHITVPDSFPVPLAEELVDRLGRSM